MRDELRSFLDSPRELREEIRRLRLQKRDDWELATAITPHYSGMPGGGGYQEGPKSSWTRLAEYDGELDEMIRRRIESIRAVEQFIDRVQEPTYRVILRYRYLNCLSWSEIEAAMSGGEYAFGLRHITRLHGKALQAARKLWESDKHDT